MAGTPDISQYPQILTVLDEVPSIKEAIDTMNREEMEGDLIEAGVRADLAPIFQSIYPGDNQTSEDNDITRDCPSSPFGIIHDSFRGEKIPGPDEYDILLMKRTIAEEAAEAAVTLKQESVSTQNE